MSGGTHVHKYDHHGSSSASKRYPCPCTIPSIRSIDDTVSFDSCFDSSTLFAMVLHTVVASSLEQGPNRDYGLSLLYLNWGQLLCFLCFNQPIRPGGHVVRCGLSVARICTLFRWAIIRMMVMEYSGIVTQMWPTNEYNKIYREFFTWTRFLFGSQWANQL